MTWAMFTALITFVGINAWTPGPNNTILLASGVNYGFRRTLPMIMGVAIGFPIMVAVVGLGLGKVFETYPIIYQILKYAGSAYLLWLAYKIAISKPSTDELRSDTKPLTFIQGALFQWINPKAWVMAVTTLSAYTLPTNYFTSLSIVVAVIALMGITSASGWALFGSSLRHVMNDPRYYRAINITLALLLVGSLAFMFVA